MFKNEFVQNKLIFFVKLQNFMYILLVYLIQICKHWKGGLWSVMVKIAGLQDFSK